MEQLKNLGLTNEDFKLIFDGLETLPNSGLAGSMFGDLLGMMLSKDATEEEKAEAKRQREREHRRRDQERQRVIEDIRILQGKLLTMKRIMEVNGLLKQVDDIFNDSRH